MRQTIVQFFLLLLPLSAMFSACQKVVSIDLNAADPHIVIEAVVTDQPGPYTVSVTQTANYFETNTVYPPVQKATVIIQDDEGISDTLHETAAGVYRSIALQGTPGHTYSLKVVTGSTEYDAASFMPMQVNIDTMYAVRTRAFDGDQGYDIYVSFKDPPAPGNYYRIRPHINSLPQDSIPGGKNFIYNDNLINGNQITERISLRRNVFPGDTITIELLSIDKATYEYFKTLQSIVSSDRSPTSLSPANPISNITNGSLGYFAAYAVDAKKIILQ
jgi:hypothetical protein